MRDITKRIAKRYLQKYNNGNAQMRKTTSFKKIKTIGILYDATFEDDVKVIKQTVTKLKALGKEVYTLGFINKKELPANRLPHTRDDFYCKKDLHWYQLPMKERVNRFANEPFDYLFNVFTADQLPLVGVSALSKAHCRLGTFHKKYTECFDVMMHHLSNKSGAELLEAYILFLYKLKDE